MTALAPFIYTLLIYTSTASVLLWSKDTVEVSPLDTFTDEDLLTLVKKLGDPELVIYKSSSELLPKFEELLDGYHKAYNPNDDINIENATEISGLEDLSLLEAKQQEDLSTGVKILSVLVVQNMRRKRDVTSPSSSTEPSGMSPTGPVLYRSQHKDSFYSLIYSSQPLLLRSANSTIELGASVSATIAIQSKDSSSRLDTTILVGEEKIILQFTFSWQNTYWSLATVKMKSTMSNSSTNLTITEPFQVPIRFSYHCNGITVFADADRTTELLIYDMQAQPDSKDGAFGDVYDCVDFTTAPIWSGLFVTAILGLGLIIALIAISEIKTMDKFDNQKTKQLAITVSE
ncbi:V-type proton ATPase subunit S1-like [Zophobas morio]|uniref:V-type proton ATPase subunit S1-like n=1 Tax=Zophobas morio TaxID=2755281 RepID=UPI003083791C